ncbi:MAG: dihydropteridine reductase [Clostridia bacterium]|nr:dihydropteridine reductase [Clostridia bacterium]
MNANDQNFIAQKIRTQYTEPQSTELDKLRELDAQVKRPANVFAYVFGSLGSLVLGTGMCLAMKIIGTGLTFAMPLGIVIGAAGIATVAGNYFIYKKLLEKRKKKYGKEILALSNKILNA